MTPVRAVFEIEMLPDFAARFGPSELVLNIGAGGHDYRDAFRCRVVTADPKPCCDLRFSAEAIPYSKDSVDGVLMMGVFERLDDPMQAMRELYRVVRPGGFVLVSILDLGFPWRKPADRWRISAGGAAHVVRAFTVIVARQVENLAHLFLLQKPVGGLS